MRPGFGRAVAMGMVGWVAAGCASPAGGAQGDPGGRTTPVDSSLARLHVYEVPVDPAAAGMVEADPGFIEVQGTASVDVPVDVAQIAFAVETRAVTAADAAAENATLMDAVLRSVRIGGFRGLELQTFGYALRPEYALNDDRVRTIEGYTALNHVSATTTDVEAVGGVIDAAIAAGANRIVSISFDTSDTEAARSEALAAAVRNARAQARVMAEALGYELGAVLEVRGGSERPFPRSVNMDAMLMRAEAAPTPIEAGDRTVTANVTVRFALGPERPGR